MELPAAELVWIFIGIILILLEFALPGLVIVFFGTSAVVVGIAVYYGLPQTMGIPFFVFTALTVLQIFVLRQRFRGWFKGDVVSERSGRDAMEDFVGREVVAITDFEERDLVGKVEFRGSNWNAQSTATLKAGERAVISGRDGLKLLINKK